MKKLSTIIVTILAICSLLIAFSVTASAEVQPPAIAAVGISYEGGDTMYMYFKLFIGENAAADQKYGMIFWKEKQADDGYEIGNVTDENAEIYDQTVAVAETFKGHSVKVFKYTINLWEMADVVYAQGYMIDSNGEYTYSSVIPYSFVTYVRNKIGINETNAGNVLVTDIFLEKMQNYLDIGTTAQKEKEYNLDNKANEVVEWNNRIQYGLDENGDVVVKGYKGSATGVYIRSTVIGGEYHGKTIVAIGDNAFSGDNEIESVTLPETIEEIGDQAFKDCTNLEKLNYNGFPEHWDEIPKGDGWADGAGKGDGDHTGEAGGTGDGETGGDTPETPVINITIIIITPKYSEGLEYTLNDDGKSYSLVGIGTCTDTDIIVPRIHNGLPVTAVKRDASSDRLHYSEHITNFKIPDGVTSLNFNFFSYYVNVDNIFVSSTVNDITCTGWSSLTKIKSITIDDRNKTYRSSGNCIIETKSKTLILGCMNSVIPDDGSITTVGDNAFNCCYGLTSITIPNGVTSIGDGAFMGCNDLASITISDGVTSIGRSAFAITAYSKDSSNWENEVLYIGNHLIEVETSVSGSYDIKEGTKCIADHAFYNCTGLTSVKIPDSVTSIGIIAFRNCTGLTNISIGNSVTSIGGWAFCNCTNLISITIPESVVSIGASAFYGCKGLSSITIPDSVTSIGSLAFDGCTGLTSITIPSSVTSMGDNPFSWCTSLSNITVDDKNTVYYSVENCIIETSSGTLIAGCKNSVIPIDGRVTSIGNNAFYGCRELTSIKIPDSVTSIGNGAFDHCTGLTSITIPNSVTSIGNWAFECCVNLTSVTISNRVKSIGRYMFAYCNGLTNITIPNSVTSIDSMAFSYCDGLTSITISNSVTSISSSAFSGCTGLTSIMVDGENSVYHSENNCLIESVSKTLIIGCKSSVIPNDGSVTRIGDCAFYGCTGLTSITIPDSVTSIGDSAFSGCTDLTSITIPDSVTSIGDSAFSGCTDLTSITIPDSVTSIGSYAFDNTAYYNDSSNWENDVLYIGNHLIEAKTSVSGSYDIKEGTKCIADRAFYRCTKLTSISMPASVVSIGDRAFWGCTKLTLIEYDSTMEAWNKILKGDDWDYNISSYSVVTSAVPTIPTDTMVYYEDFNNVSTVDELGWTKLNPSDGLVSKSNTATYALENGRLKISGGDNESYTMVKNSGYMRAACLGDYTVQYDVEYTGSPSSNSIYFNLLTNFMNYSYCNSIHFRLDGTADNQVRYSGWYDYDVVGAYDADGLDTDATGQSVISKLTNGETTYVEGASPMLNRSFTVKLQVSRENGITVWARDNTREGADFVCVSKSDTQSDGWKYWNAINAYAICLKTRPNITGYIDNIAIWTGLGDMPTDTTTTAYETAIAGN